jgi:hypothetical protein
MAEAAAGASVSGGEKGEQKCQGGAVGGGGGARDGAAGALAGMDKLDVWFGQQVHFHHIVSRAGFPQPILHILNIIWRNSLLQLRLKTFT